MILGMKMSMKNSMKNWLLKNFVFLVVIIIIFYNNSYSQKWSSYSVNNGLSDNSISSIVEDDHGNIWVGTDDGLNCFDGEKWNQIRRADGYSLINDSITDILKDTGGNLWIATWKGISKINPGDDLNNPMSWKNYNKTNTNGGLVANNIISIEEDDDANLWIGIFDQGVCIVNPIPGKDQDPLLDPGNWTFINSDSQLIKTGFGFIYLYDIEKDILGNIWVGTGGGVSRYDPDRHHFNDKWDLFPEFGDTRSIFSDSHGYIWFGRFGEGVARAQAENLDEKKEFLLAVDTQVIGEDSDRNIWFGTAGTFSGIFVVDPKSDLNHLGNWLEIKKEHGLASNVINSIFQDSEGDMWIGTASSGISKYDISWMNFNISQNSNLKFAYVSTITEDDANNLWLGTNDDGLRIVNLHDNLLVNESWRTIRKSEKGLASNIINVIFKDDAGYIWIGTQDQILPISGGLNLINPLSDLSDTENWSKFTVENTDTGLTNNTVNSIAQDSARYMWFGTNNGLSRVHRSSVFADSSWTSFSTSDGLNSSEIKSILIDHQNILWLGTLKGLNRLNLAGDLRTDWENIEVLDGKEVISIFQDIDHQLWFGTINSGIYVLNSIDDPHNSIDWRRFTIKNGLASNSVSAIVQTRPGEFWFATTGGLTRLRVTQMKGQLDSLWTVFSADDGPQDIIIMSAFKDSKGDLWLGTASKGVTRHRIKMNPPDTFIETKLDITTADNIVIKYSGADLNTHSDQLKFSYQIDSTGWQPFLQSNLVQFYNLAFGRHLFEVRSMDLDGNIDPMPAKTVFYKISQQLGGNVEICDTLNNGSVSLYFPPGELETGKGATITPLKNYQLNDTLVIVAYEITPTPEYYFILDKPATLAISFLNNIGYRNNQLAIFRQENNKWISFGGTLATMGATVTITTVITQFGIYAVRKIRGSPGNPETLNIQPRLFSPLSGSQGHGDITTISFVLENDSPVTVKVYNLGGRLKRVLTENILFLKGINAIEWNGKDDQGNICPSGLYIVTVVIGGKVQTKTVMVSNKYYQK